MNINEIEKILLADDGVDDTTLQAIGLDLLAEVIRLRELMLKGSNDYTTSYTDLRDIIEVTHWELTSGEHKSNEVRIKYALISLSEVIG